MVGTQVRRLVLAGAVAVASVVAGLGAAVPAPAVTEATRPVSADQSQWVDPSLTIQPTTSSEPAPAPAATPFSSSWQ